MADASRVAALGVRACVTAELVEQWLVKADALLLPVHTESALRLVEILDEVEGRKPPRPDLGLYTRWTNYLGLPAILRGAAPQLRAWLRDGFAAARKAGGRMEMTPLPREVAVLPTRCTEDSCGQNRI